MNLLTEGKRNVAKLKDESMNTTPRRARRIRAVWQQINVMVLYTPDEAKILLTDTKLTKSQYKKIRRQVKHKTADI
jgi:hypothetical protein